MKAVLEAIKLLRAIEPAGRMRVYVVLFLFALTGAVLEMLGVGLVFGLVSVVVKTNVADAVPRLGPVLDIIKSMSGEANPALTIGLTMVAIFVAKNLFKIAFNYFQAGVVNRWIQEMTCRLFSIYVNAPYVFHKETNSSQMIRNSAGLIIVSYGGTVKAITNIAVNALMITMLALVLIYFQPIPAIIAGSLVVILVGGQNFLFGGMLQRLGAEHYNLAERNLRNLLQGYGAIKEIKVLGRKSGFLRQFGIIQERWARLRQVNEFVKSLPPIFAELSLVLTVVVLVVMLLAITDSPTDIIPVVALFGAAAMRILPSANQILGFLHQINSNLPGLRILRGEIHHPWGEVRLEQSTVAEALPYRQEIRFEDVSYEYPNGDSPAVHEVNLIIPKGEYLGVIGGSGAGKSTLIDILLGLLTASSGRVLADGADIARHLDAWQLNLGYVPQEIYVADDTIRANVAFGMFADDIEDESVWRALKLAQMDEFVASLPDGLDTVLGERGDRLSGGQRQRIGIARALYRDPKILVFDEPTSALDADIEREISRALLSLKGDKTIIVIAHRLNMLANCDRLIVLRNGRIVDEGSYQALVDRRLSLPGDAAEPFSEAGTG